MALKACLSFDGVFRKIVGDPAVKIRQESIEKRSPTCQILRPKPMMVEDIVARMQTDKKKRKKKTNVKIPVVTPGSGSDKGVKSGSGKVKIATVSIRDHRTYYLAGNKYRAYINSPADYDKVYIGPPVFISAKPRFRLGKPVAQTRRTRSGRLPRRNLRSR